MLVFSIKFFFCTVIVYIFSNGLSLDSWGALGHWNICCCLHYCHLMIKIQRKNKTNYNLILINIGNEYEQRRIDLLLADTLFMKEKKSMIKLELFLK